MAIIAGRFPAGRCRLSFGAYFLALMLVSQIAQAQYLPTLTNGLVGWWRAEEGSGALALDSSTNANTGYIQNGAWTNGVLGGGIRYNGTSTRVVVSNSAKLSITGAMTLATWIFPQSWTGMPRIISRVPSFQWYVDATNNQLVYEFPGLTDGVVRCAAPNSLEWSHIAATFDGQTMVAYLNGVVVTQTAFSGSIAAATNINIGALNNSSAATNYFNGRMDETRIYRRALSQDEIAALALAPPAGRRQISPAISSNVSVVSTGLMARFSTTFGNTCQDMSGIGQFRISNDVYCILFCSDEADPDVICSAVVHPVAVDMFLGWPVGSDRLRIHVVNWQDEISVFDYVMPESLDSDGDGLPDGWEFANGTDALLDDAAGDLDGDGLSNRAEYCLGSRANGADSDGDSLSDSDEVNGYGTDPANADTDGDGMSDGWEAAYGLNPRIDDAGADLDLDGLTNLQEFERRDDDYLPSVADSLDDGLSDYERVFGETPSQFYYDELDRLVGAFYNHGPEGLAIAYEYDGNGNILRQKHLKRDQDGDRLPDLWEYLNGLSLSADNSLDDTDDDGWPDAVEWVADSHPADSASFPGSQSVAGETIASIDLPYLATNFVMAVGQMDDGSEEIAVGADGSPSGGTNAIFLIKRAGNVWTEERIPVPDMGVTSLAIGNPGEETGRHIYVGTRGIGVPGQLWDVSENGGNWNVAELPIGNTGTAVYVLGVRAGRELLVEAAISNSEDRALFFVGKTNGVWTALLYDTNGADRVRSVLEPVGRSAAAIPSEIRLLDAGGVRYGQTRLLPADAIWRTNSTSWYFPTTNSGGWSNAQAYAELHGANLVCIGGEEENAWVWTNYAALGTYSWIGLYCPTGTVENIGNWRWIDGAPVNYTNWNVIPSTESYKFGQMMSSSGKWRNRRESDDFQGIGEMDAPLLLSEGDVSNRTEWAGGALAAGTLRSNAVSVFALACEDANGNGRHDMGDNLVLAEHEVAAGETLAHAPVRIPVLMSSSPQIYAASAADLLNSERDLLFTGEPGGRVYAWSTATGTGALVRQLFSTQYVGSSWHQLGAVKSYEPGEGLAGLVVSPSNPAHVDVVFWAPQRALDSASVIPSNTPLARIMAGTNEGYGVTGLEVKLWDPESDRAFPEIQFSFSMADGWTNAAILSLDGQPYVWAMEADAAPAGSTHLLLWDSMADLTNGFSGTVYLRARALDGSGWGPWSDAVPFAMEVRPDSDQDGLPDTWELDHDLDPLSADGVNGPNGHADDDGLDNLSEYYADTDPQDGQSALEITGIGTFSGGIRIGWKGGRQARQVIETLEILPSSEGQDWLPIYTNMPPTEITNSVIDAGSTNGKAFYRIKVER